MSAETPVPTLERAVELLWQAGHPAIGEALESEVLALVEKAYRLEAIVYPKVVVDREASRVLGEEL